MIIWLASTVLVVIIGVFIKAHLLPIARHAFLTWVWLITAVMPQEECEGRREEALSWIFEEIEFYQGEGYPPSETAIRILEDWVKGVPRDIESCAPFLPKVIADRVAGWGDNLRHYRVPATMVAGVAALGFMNYGFFTSPNEAVGPWVFVNVLVLAMTALQWKIKHPIARRILYSWMGVAMVGSMVVLAWLTMNYRLYEVMTFKVLMLAMAALSPAIIVVDKSWRSRLFKGRWWLIAICWAALFAGALGTSWLTMHDVKPLIEMWATIALLLLALIVVFGTIALASFVLCWAGIRGSAGGLRLVAAGIRRLR